MPSKAYAYAKAHPAPNSGAKRHWLWDRCDLSLAVKPGKRKSEFGGYAMDEPAISFGPFRLVAARRLLLEGDKPVRLGGRAFDILAALVERAGEVVTKEALIARVWPQTFVEEANLKIQVSALRRALGDGQGDNRYIVTVPGRGYNFVAPVRLRNALAPTRPLEIVAGKQKQSTACGNSGHRPRRNRGDGRRTTFAPASGDDRRARRHRQDDCRASPSRST